VLLGLGSIFLPFIMILGFQATGADAASSVILNLIWWRRWRRSDAVDVAARESTGSFATASVPAGVI
jgi:hypothetical protein